MGTFHSDKGELHGITVVVDTKDAVVYIGRCWEMNDQEIVLLDVDEHEYRRTATRSRSSSAVPRRWACGKSTTA
jgi:hypothetical protein